MRSEYRQLQTERNRMRLPSLLPRETKQFDVTGLGENSYELAATIDGFPQANAKHVASTLVAQSGGQVATAMVACVRLGCRAQYIGVIGDDDGGVAVERWLRSERIETRLIRRSQC